MTESSKMEQLENQTSYDNVPYDSQPFPQSHPDRLATLGKLFGLSPTSVTRCRVLELGCAGGGNLIPMAYHLPESEFVGVDLSSRQVEMGAKAIRDLNLKNVRLEHGSILDVDASWGFFDYIICHGVYSWVSDQVHEQILTVCSKNLAPQGIAYVSYNTYPGWHMREMIRHMMRYHANQFIDTKEQIEQARALIDFLASSVPTENCYYGILLKDELELIKRCKDSYLFHEHLEEINAPIYFHQFMERCSRHGLQYLAEADFSTMLTSGFPTEVADTLRRISHHIVRTEQYMDFLRNRLFRQTLLCHEGLPLKRELDAEDVKPFLFASAVTPAAESVDLQPGCKDFFRTPRGATVDTDCPITKAAFLVLGDCWPRAIDLTTLYDSGKALLDAAAVATQDDKEARRVLAEDLLGSYTENVVELHTWQGNFITEVSDRPVVSELAAYQARNGSYVANQRHEPVTLDPVTQQFVSVMDGSRTHDDLMRHLVERVHNGTLTVHQDNDAITDPAQIESSLRAVMEQALPKLAKAALLVG
jgi:methyltransferase-like protein/2-polyprenyl-3-methyl-5-hydroxy-6-metoxy-1,4-benzoquinol methylase